MPKGLPSAVVGSHRLNGLRGFAAESCFQRGVHFFGHQQNAATTWAIAWDYSHANQLVEGALANAKALHLVFNGNVCLGHGVSSLSGFPHGATNRFVHLNCIQHHAPAGTMERDGSVFHQLAQKARADP
jgi:hypothetical protein